MWRFILWIWAGCGSDAPTGGTFRLIHVAPAAGPITPTLDGSAVEDALRYGEGSAPLPLAAGSHTVNAGDHALTFSVRDGQTLTALHTARGLYLVDHAAPVPSEAHVRIRMVHVAPDAPTLRVVRDGTQLASVEPFSETPVEGFELHADAGASLDVEQVGRFELPALPQRSHMLLVATGQLSSTQTPFGLLAVAPSAVHGFVPRNTLGPGPLEPR